MQQNLKYWTKNANKLDLPASLSWNFPEQKSGEFIILGGNKSSFSEEVKASEYLNKTFPFFSSVKNYFPDSLKPNFPPLENLEYFDATESGSFARSADFRDCLKGKKFGLLLGDFSKNSETSLALGDLLKESEETPLLLARDAIDSSLLNAEEYLSRDNVILLASLAQLQKLFRAVYYPKVLLLSEPLLPVIETLHKFTLSYPVHLLTFHQDKVIAASDGKIMTSPLVSTDYSPISLWSGQLAVNIAIYYLFNQSRPLESLIAGLHHK